MDWWLVCEGHQMSAFRGRRTEVKQDTTDNSELDCLLCLDLAGLFCSVESVLRFWYEDGFVDEPKSRIVRVLRTLGNTEGGSNVVYG